MNNVNVQQTYSFSSVLNDGGPFYRETNLDAFIVEPWNALSSLTFLIPVIYWAIILKGKYKDFAFLAYCLPLLFFGGIGSALYHAFRNSSFFLLMDVLPVAILTFSVSIYFWNKILKDKWVLGFVILLFLSSRFIIYQFLSKDLNVHLMINLSYFITGFMIFFPALLYLMRTHFYQLKSLVLACIFLILSLLFREMDTWTPPLLPMGTHWLWHTSTAIGSWFLGEYLFRIRQREQLKKVLNTE